MLKNERGFSLLELIIVVAVLAIIVTVALPALLRSRVNANESATKSNLKTFSSSIEAYRANQTPPTYPADFSSLTGATPPYLDTTWGSASSINKSGYTLNYALTDASRYALYAEPMEAGVTGNNSLCVDETGLVWTSSTSLGAFTGSPCSAGTGATTLS